MKKVSYLIISVLMVLVAAPMSVADNYNNDDIYYTETKAKKKTKKEKAKKIVKDTPTEENYNYEDYNSGYELRDVDEYNRRGAYDYSYSYTDSLPYDSMRGYTYTNRIERFYNPNVVDGSGNQELIDSYNENNSEINIYIDPSWYPYRYNSRWGFSIGFTFPYYWDPYWDYYRWYNPWTWTWGWPCPPYPHPHYSYYAHHHYHHGNWRPLTPVYRPGYSGRYTRPGHNNGVARPGYGNNSPSDLRRKNGNNINSQFRPNRSRNMNNGELGNRKYNIPGSKGSDSYRRGISKDKDRNSTFDGHKGSSRNNSFSRPSSPSYRSGSYSRPAGGMGRGSGGSFRGGSGRGRR